MQPEILEAVRGSERTTERIARQLYETQRRLTKSYGCLRMCGWDDLPVSERAMLTHAIGDLLAQGIIRLPEP